ncbi:MAG: HYR domain-containing protein [Saprospiraceae bacterium]|nr:HYR domain-containing protein [Saprospiraceae bacterium]
MFRSAARIIFSLAFFFHNNLVFSQDPDCPAPTFFKTFGQVDRSEFATAITHTPDGNLYVTGRNNNRTFIQKISLSGQVIWMRDFQISPFEPITPAEIIVDSEGMIVGCGTQAQFAGARRGFVFRYNPNLNTVLWAHPIASNNPVAGGILENGAGGHYVYYHNPILNNGESDIEVLNLDRTTGAVIPAFARRYEFVSSDRLSKMITVNGSLFGVGWSEVDSNTTDFRRVLLARFDPVNGEPIWARLGHLDFTQQADLYGRDLIADGDALISSYIGTTAGTPGVYQLFLQKTNLDGIIEWVRSYNVYSSATKLLSVPDGYVIYGNRLGNEHIVLKTDKDGEVLWSKMIDFGPVGQTDEGNLPPNMGVAAADSLYFAGISTSGVSDVSLWKILNDGTMVDSCDYVDSLSVQSTLVINPGNIPVDLQNTISTAVFTNATPALTDNSLAETLVCPDCTEPDPCPENNDFGVIFTGLDCVNGKIQLGISFCDFDGGLLSDNLSISIYNGNPFTEPADRLHTFAHDSISFTLVQNCSNELLVDLTALFGAANVEDGDQLYVVVNDPGDTNTPYSLGDFPLSHLAECDYTNNMDSLTVNLPTAPTLHLGADQVICANQSVTLDAGAGFYRYQWSNGATTQSTTISFGGNYRVTVTDICGFRQFDTVQIQVLQLPLVQESGSFCPGKSVTIRGFTFDQTGNFQKTIPGLNGDCDTVATFNISQLPYQEKIINVNFCPFTTVTINGQTYEDSGLVRDTVPSAVGCDTILLYFLNQLPLPFRNLHFEICPGDSVKFNGSVYYQPTSFMDTLYSTGFGCDTAVTVTISLLQNVEISDTLRFCPGSSVVIGGQSYTQPGIVQAYLPATTGCDTLVNYHLEWLPAPTLSESVTFCPGSSVTINGQSYTQPGTVIVTIPGTGGGCDTVITYNLSYVNLPPSNLSISCPNTVNVATTPGTGPVPVNFAAATANSDCACDDMDISQTSGPASGALFPVGNTQVCFKAEDACGSEKTCCFIVTVREEAPCDTKTSGCLVYELLSINANADQERTYSIRVTNNCTNKLTYTAIELPSGVTAVAPANLSTYTSPDGHDYAVRNPNFSPFYSIRFKSNGDGISNGESDVFSYTLPAQSQPTFINIISRLEPQIFLSAHLNTFNCPIGTSNRDATPQLSQGAAQGLVLFPNPTDGVLFADLSNWQNQPLDLRVLDARGAVLQQWSAQGGGEAQAIPLADQLSAGLYFLEVRDQAGRREVARFVLN